MMDVAVMIVWQHETALTLMLVALQTSMTWAGNLENPCNISSVLITYETVACNRAQCKPKVQNADSENHFQPEVSNNILSCPGIVEVMLLFCTGSALQQQQLFWKFRQIAACTGSCAGRHTVVGPCVAQLATPHTILRIVH